MALKLSRTWFNLLPELRFEPAARRIRARLESGLVLDTTDALLVWEPGRVTPIFAVPTADLAADVVPSSAPAADLRPAPVMDPRFPFSVHTTGGTAFDLVAAAETLPAAAFMPNDPDLGGRVLLDFSAFHQWLEEDQEIKGHPRDPFHRVDARESSRASRVEFRGQTLAETAHPLFVYETMVPVRTYYPRDDVDWRLLEPTATQSVCPYKGTARYWSVAGTPEGEDLAWSYESILPDSAQLQDRVCFYDERTDVFVDGQKREIAALFKF
ncbi:DUF427 domain-containing protein [Arthrobacter gandavensis]|uniref:DUF427 domain-containing protein n=1 Tax=Arthrobacter gandavensis TaxID=169960 RepID=UPI0018901BB2|nr:DUF427 domain-containing protein [Arthrobacter gandavensis]MBF4994312.1 DUF427 domain-containing protein [Arthrobacter gandavensis]